MYIYTLKSVLLQGGFGVSELYMKRIGEWVKEKSLERERRRELEGRKTRGREREEREARER